MPLSIPARRVFRLSKTEPRLAVQAARSLVEASLAIQLMSFRKVVELGSRRDLCGSIQPDTRRQFVGRAVSAIDAIADSVPWRAVCFQRAVALRLLLARHGIGSDLHYGIGHADNDELAAHVWVSVDDEIVLGAEAAVRFARVASFSSGA